jgi:hypothetical protein
VEWTTESVKATIDARYPHANDMDREWHSRSNRDWWPRRSHRGHGRVARAARHAA